MKVTEILEEWKKDCIIDETDLAHESSVVTYELHGKYLQFYSNEKMLLKAMRKKRRVLVKTLREYYRGDLNNHPDLVSLGREPWRKKILKGEVDDYVESDTDVLNLQDRIDIQEEKVDLLKEIVSAINKRSFNIGNSIAFLKWTSGG